MSDILYDLWAASLQDGYIGELIGIVEKCGGSKSLYKMTDQSMEKVGFSKRMIKHIINRRNTFDLEKEYEYLEKENIRFIRFCDAEYPSKLKAIDSAPFALFVKGQLPLENSPSVAIVGARDCSEYGRLVAEYFGDKLSKAGVQTISGMAYGIDGLSQMASVKAGGKSFAVLGCGVDVIYPKSNASLYHMLIENGGVISEYAPGTQSCSRNFPPRNRIISGLCDILLVVEAKAKSGTLITADLAIDQGKDVMIVPGRITDPLSVGCINLLKNGAEVALNAENIIERLTIEFGYNTGDNKMRKTAGINTVCESDFSKEESEVYNCLDYYPIAIDSIAKLLSKDLSSVLLSLTSLEIKGAIKCVGQDAFVKIS